MSVLKTKLLIMLMLILIRCFHRLVMSPAKIKWLYIILLGLTLLLPSQKDSNSTPKNTKQVQRSDQTILSQPVESQVKSPTYTLVND